MPQPKRIELWTQITRADGTVEEEKLAAVYDADDPNVELTADGRIHINTERVGELNESGR
jgi:hypothetical protein